MGYENCSMCGKLFDKTKGNLCQVCSEIEQKNLKKITDYFHTLDKSVIKPLSIKSLNSATGVSVKEIERLYRANKLRGYTEFIQLTCKLCGSKFKPTIFSGVLCKNCTQKVEVIVKELKESGSVLEQTVIEQKIKEIIIPKEKEKKEENDSNKGMHAKNDSKQRYGFKKN